jgi:hypothetical protein
MLLWQALPSSIRLIGLLAAAAMTGTVALSDSVHQLAAAWQLPLLLYCTHISTVLSCLLVNSPKEVTCGNVMNLQNLYNLGLIGPNGDVGVLGCGMPASQNSYSVVKLGQAVLQSQRPLPSS